MGEEASILRQGVGGTRTYRMKVISVHLPEPYLQIIDELVRQKYYLSRADVIRTALHDLIVKERINLISDQIRGS
jgi:Arc/MetJ-type ribon-helix-helix transcriptional regulator